ncbi:MAG: NfeD family protein [Anaerolineales bacterium]
MDLLLNPNLAYLLLMVGTLLALLAVLTPGTGLLELGAVIVLVVVGIQLFNIPINLWALGLVVVGAGIYVLSVIRRGDPVLMAAGLVVIYIGTALIYRSETSLIAADIWLILLASLGEGTFLWVVTRKVLAAAESPPIQDLEALIGTRGETRTRVFGDGTVYADGEEWSARSSQPIPANSVVIIKAREGFTLVVEPLEDRAEDLTESEA